MASPGHNELSDPGDPKELPNWRIRSEFVLNSNLVHLVKIHNGALQRAVLSLIRNVATTGRKDVG